GPVGRRTPSGADRRSEPASPAPDRGRGRRDRADLSSRLRGTGVLVELCGGARGRVADAVRPPGAPRDLGHGHPPHRLPGPALAPARGAGARAMSTVVLSVYKVANFPDGGGHFWAYMQYAAGLRRLGREVYCLEQFRPLRDPEREPALRKTLLERMQPLGLEGRTLLYTRA